MRWREVQVYPHEPLGAGPGLPLFHELAPACPFLFERPREASGWTGGRNRSTMNVSPFNRLSSKNRVSDPRPEGLCTWSLGREGEKR